MPKRITRNARDVAAMNMARKSRRQISVCIMGSETCASAIAKVVGGNCAKNPEFQKRVPMFVFEEMVNGKKLSRIINKTHVNVKYLPGHKLPPNVVAVGDEVKAARNADIIIFVLPRQLLPKVCEALIGRVKKTAIGISLIKGFEKGEDGGLDLISRNISRYLEIPCAVLMGANLANDVAEEKFSEATIGCRDFNDAKLLRDLFQSDNFRVYVVDDADAVEVCGTLRNVVACGAGFVDGLGLGDNTKSAVIRLGLMEMIKFVQAFYPGGKLNTFFQSAGVADLVATCYGGPNRQVAEALVKSGKPLRQLEADLLKGEELQGAATAREVNYLLKKEEMEDKFPLFTAVHKICTNELKPKDLIDRIRFHPDSMQDLKPGLPRGTATRRRIVSWMKPCCGPVVTMGGKCNRSSCRYHTWNRPLITPLPASQLTTRSCLHCKDVNQRQQFSSVCRYVPKWKNRLLSFCCAPKMRSRLALNLGMLMTTACAMRLCDSSSF